MRRTRRERVEGAICMSRAVSVSDAPASTASTVRRLRRKRTRCGPSRVESSKGASLLVLWSLSFSSSSDVTPPFSVNSEGRGSGRMGRASGDRQIRGVSRVRETEVRSTKRCPRAAASAHRFQVAASRSAWGQRSPRRSTTSCTQAASPQGQTTSNAS